MGASTYEYTSNERIRFTIYIGVYNYIEFYSSSSISYCKVSNNILFSTWSV